jgi:hypothetical protein
MERRASGPVLAPDEAGAYRTALRDLANAARTATAPIGDGADADFLAADVSALRDALRRLPPR